jgi:Gram-negative bacterial TonB protein C-terminal
VQPPLGLRCLVTLTVVAALVPALARAAASTSPGPAPSPPPASASAAPDTSHGTVVREVARAHAATADSARAAAPVAPMAPAVSANDTTIGGGARLPGTRLRFGEGAGRARRYYALAPGDPGEVAGGELLLAGDVMYFGMPSKGKLVFDPGGLTRATFVVATPSPHQRDYLEDQLTRFGLRRDCERRDDRASECDWTGAVMIHVKCDSALMTAEVVTVGGELSRSLHLPTAEDRARAAEEARLRPYLTDPTPILPDTLSLDPAAPPGPMAPPMLIKTAPPIYDDALAERGVKGIVQVLALVGLDGLVNYSRATDGPAELHEPALRTVAHFRFSGYTYNGQKVRFWVWIPVRFGV